VAEVDDLLKNNTESIETMKNFNVAQATILEKIKNMSNDNLKKYNEHKYKLDMNNASIKKHETKIEELDDVLIGRGK
jgi:predicted transcriptional regulator